MPALLTLAWLSFSACGVIGASEPEPVPARDLGAIVDERVQRLIKDDIALLRSVANEGKADASPPAAPPLSLGEAVRALKQNAQAPERDNVQASIDAYMVANNYTTLPAGRARWGRRHGRQTTLRWYPKTRQLAKSPGASHQSEIPGESQLKLTTSTGTSAS